MSVQEHPQAWGCRNLLETFGAEGQEILRWAGNIWKKPGRRKYMNNYLTLKQVCNILQVKPAAIRTWEQEFADILAPYAPKDRSRVYTQRQLELFAQIKELLQTEHYTIKGARRRLELDEVLTNSLGVEHNFKNTVFFMFSAIMQELQAAREDSKRLARQVELLRREKLEMENRLLEEQNKSFLEFLKTKVKGAKGYEKRISSS